MKFPSAKKMNLVKTALLAASVMICLVSMTLAWFITAERSDLDNVNLEAENVDALLVYDEALEDWVFTADVDLSQIELTAICGDGQAFFSPTFSDKTVFAGEAGSFDVYKRDENDIELTDITDDVLNGPSSQYAVSYQFKIHSGTAAGIVIGENSRVTASKNQGKTGYIGGAMRVAVYLLNPETETYDLKCIWFPNAAYEYNPNAQDIAGLCKTSGKPETAYTLIHHKDYYGHIADADAYALTVQTDETGYYYNEENGVYYVWDATECPVIFDVRGDYTDETVKVVAWIEGTDRECRNEFMGDRLTVQLSLTAQK